MAEQRTALVIGASGGIGGEVARLLLARGWGVRGLNRDPEGAARRRPDLAVAWVKGDSMRSAEVVAAAQGASLIVHAANPPGYRNWAGTVLPMLDILERLCAGKGKREDLADLERLGQQVGAGS